MSSRKLLVLSVLFVAAASARAADPVPFDPLSFVPANAAAVMHLDVATIHDLKALAPLRDAKSAEVKLVSDGIGKMLGVDVGNVATFTYIVPEMGELRREDDLLNSISVVTSRKEYDRPALVAQLKKKAADGGFEFAEKGERVYLKATHQFTRTSVYDLSRKNAIVAVVGLDEELLTPANAKAGVVLDAVRPHAKAAAVAAINFDAFLPTILRGGQVPEELRKFQAIAEAQSGLLVGTFGPTALDVTLTLKCKEKQDAFNAEQSLDEGKKLLEGLLAAMKDGLKPDNAEDKAFVALLAAAEKTVAGVKSKATDTTVTATASLPLDLPFKDILAAVKASADRLTVQNNLKQIGLAMHNHLDVHNSFPQPASKDNDGKPLLSWRVQVLPYLEEGELYKKFNLDEPWDSKHNLAVLKDNPMPKAFALPGGKAGEKKTHYQVFVGNGAAFDPENKIGIVGITDGSSNTLLAVLGETAVDWTKPDDIEFDPSAEMLKKLLFKGGVTPVLMADGSVRNIKKSVTEAALKAAITRAGGEVSTLDD